MRGFFAGFFSVLGGLPLLYGLLLLLLANEEHLPPPPFSGRWDVDRKLQDLRAGRPERIDLLLIGSSTTFYGVDGGVLRAQLGGRIAVFHASSPGLKIHQSEFLTRFYVEHFPKIESAIMVSTPLDFENCPRESAAIFDSAQVRRYLAASDPEIFWHFKYFDPAGVFETMLRRPVQATMPLTRLDLRLLDPYGGQQLDPLPENVPQSIFEGVFPEPDPRCYQALGRLTRFLHERGIRFLFAQAPLRPGYLARHDPDGRRLIAHLARVRQLLAQEGGHFLNLHEQLALPEAAFFDAYHIRAPYVPLQTRTLAEALQRLSRPPMPEIAGSRNRPRPQPAPDTAS